MPNAATQTIVESVRKIDAKKGDAVLVKIRDEMDGPAQYALGREMQLAFPGVFIFIAGPSADIEVVRDKMDKGWRGKEESNGEGT